MRIADVNATICPRESVEYLRHVEQIGDTTTLSWSIGSVVLSSYVRVQGLINETEGEIQLSPQLPGVIANLTEITPSGFTSILSIESAGISVANQTIIQCSGTGLERAWYCPSHVSGIVCTHTLHSGMVYVHIMIGATHLCIIRVIRYIDV